MLSMFAFPYQTNVRKKNLMKIAKVTRKTNQTNLQKKNLMKNCQNKSTQEKT